MVMEMTNIFMIFGCNRAFTHNELRNDLPFQIMQTKNTNAPAFHFLDKWKCWSLLIWNSKQQYAFVAFSEEKPFCRIETEYFVFNV